MSSNDVLLILLGWLLGLLAPAIVDAIKNRRETKTIKTALFTELQELQYRLVLMVYRIQSKYDNLNKNFFQWAQNILSEYKGINSSNSLVETIGPILKLTDEEMKVYSQVAKEGDLPNSGLELKKFSFSLLDSSLLLLSKLNPILQGHLLETKTHIGFMNEIVDDSRYYFRLSFQNDISTANYNIAKNNMINSYKMYASQARVVIDLISKILPKK